MSEDISPKEIPIVSAKDKIITDTTQYPNQVGGQVASQNSVTKGTGNNMYTLDVNGLYMGSADWSSAPFKVDYSGNAVINSLIVTGGTIKSGKQSFTDSINAGYYIGVEGIYIGSALDASYLKYTVSPSSFNYVGNISGRDSAVIAAAISSVGHFIDSNLDTSAKQILGSFTFGASGAIAMNTDANNGLWISPTGILGKKAGVNTFAIDTSGNATFAGTLSAAAGTLGTITAGTLNGVLIIGSTIETQSTNPAVKIDTAQGVTIAGKSLWFTRNASTGTVLDSYPTSNYDSDIYLSSTEKLAVSQSFTPGSTKNISYAGVQLYLRKLGSPTGNMTVSIFAHAGTYGTNSVPTGAALATSDNVDVSILTTTHQIISFNFSGANIITLTSGTHYVLVLNYSGGDNVNDVYCGTDRSSPTHGGNWATSTDGINFDADNTRDLIFYVNSGNYITQAGRIWADASGVYGINIDSYDQNGADTGLGIEINTPTGPLLLQGYTAALYATQTNGGGIYLDTDITLTNGSGNVVVHNGALIPFHNATVEDIGSSSKYWRDAYVQTIKFKTFSESSPVNGELWTNGADFNIRINGVNYHINLTAF